MLYVASQIILIIAFKEETVAYPLPSILTKLPCFKLAMVATLDCPIASTKKLLVRGAFPITVSALLLILLPACTNTDKGYVQREWSKSLRELGIVPIFPPREDVYVGDIYAYPYDPDSLSTDDEFLSRWSSLTEKQKQERNLIGMSPRLARMDLNALILNEYASTISSPATTAEYNGILGNPALDEATQKVAESEQKLKSLRDVIAAATKSVADADAKLLNAQRAKADAKAAADKAQEKLTLAQNAPIDSSVEAAKLKTAKDDLIIKNDAVVAAQRAEEDAPDDEAKKSAARLTVLAKRNQADATTAVGRAQAALDAKLAEPKIVDAQKVALVNAKDILEQSTTAELDAARKKEDAGTALSAATTSQAAPIAEATAAVESAKAIQAAIAKAGARMLYSQPRDGKRNVYSADLLDPGISPDDTKGSRINRFRLVGFPGFATTSFSQGDLSALIPVEALGFGINISRTNIESVSVSVPAAESYGLSLNILLNKLVTKDLYNNWRMTQALLDYVDVARAQTNNIKTVAGKMYIRVFAEVFYARALDVSIFSANSFGALAQLSSPLTLIGAQTDAGDASKLPAMSPANINSSAVSGSSNANDMLGSIQARLGTTQSVPGGSIQLVSYNDKSVGLRRVFDRPIAIGVRAITFTIDLTTNEVIGIGTGVGISPAAAPSP